MKNRLILFLCVLTLCLSVSAEAHGKPKKKKSDGKTTVACPSKTKLKKGIIACPETGCGRVDELLNKQKNIKDGSPDSARDMNFADFANPDKLPKLVAGYKKVGDPRDVLKAKGEGDMVRVVAWALDARPQKTSGKNQDGTPKRGETCNCGFTGLKDPQNTDVHIVLVDDETLKLKGNATKAKPPSAKHPQGVKARTAVQNTLTKREKQSQTAEYAPRIRIARNEPFDGAKLKTLIDPTHGGRLQVRITGLLMYDSEHAVGPNKLVRRTDWEIHPVFRLEFCPKGKVCAVDSDWVDINK